MEDKNQNIDKLFKDKLGKDRHYEIPDSYLEDLDLRIKSRKRKRGNGFLIFALLLLIGLSTAAIWYFNTIPSSNKIASVENENPKNQVAATENTKTENEELTKENKTSEVAENTESTTNPSSTASTENTKDESSNQSNSDIDQFNNSDNKDGTEVKPKEIESEMKPDDGQVDNASKNENIDPVENKQNNNDSNVGDSLPSNQKTSTEKNDENALGKDETQSKPKDDKTEQQKLNNNEESNTQKDKSDSESAQNRESGDNEIETESNEDEIVDNEDETEHIKAELSEEQETGTITSDADSTINETNTVDSTVTEVSDSDTIQTERQETDSTLVKNTDTDSTTENEIITDEETPRKFWIDVYGIGGVDFVNAKLFGNTSEQTNIFNQNKTGSISAHYGLGANFNFKQAFVGLGVSMYNFSDKVSYQDYETTTNTYDSIVPIMVDSIIYDTTGVFPIDTVQVQSYDTTTYNVTDSTLNDYSTENKYQIVAIPLSVGYTFILNKWRFRPQLNAIFEFRRKQYTGSYPIYNGSTTLEQLQSLKFGMSLGLSLQVQRNIRDWYVYARPGYRFRMMNVAENGNYYIRHHAFQAHFGVGYTF